jgi:DNA-directed RNA polymerase specialized sigma24 family protein
MSSSRESLPDDVDAPERVFAIYSAIATRCVLAGLGASEAEDLAQDVWEWLIRSGNLALAGVAPWLAAVTINFVRRHRRRRMRERFLLQKVRLDVRSSADNLTTQVETKQFLDRLATRSRESERQLLDLMRQDWRLSEASEQLGIPKGSEQFRLRKLRKEARQIAHPFSGRRTRSRS